MVSHGVKLPPVDAHATDTDLVRSQTGKDSHRIEPRHHHHSSSHSTCRGREMETGTHCPFTVICACLNMRRASLMSSKMTDWIFSADKMGNVTVRVTA